MNVDSESPMTHAPAAPRRNNWLIASVALNTFLLGGIASAVLLGPHGPGMDGRPPMHGAGHGPGFRPFADGLSEAGRAAVMAQRAADDSAMASNLAALRAARAAMDAAFAADPFDRPAFDAAFAQMRAAEAAMSASMGERVAALAAALSPEDRKAFAQNLRRLPMGPPGSPSPMPERR